MEANNYQYWSRVATDGSFKIANARPGTYTLYAFVDGEVGQYMQANVTVTAGETHKQDIVWAVPRTGNWLAWEIGKPDRDTTEFHHGNNYFMPYLYKGFALKFPNPLIYTVGVSNPAKDWNYMQSGYHPPNAPPVPWKWQIKFNLPQITKDGDATLILAIAGSNRGKVEVNVNDGSPLAEFTPAFDGGNGLLRQGSHGKYSVRNVTIPMSKLHVGANTIELVEANFKEDASYVAYDYVALEMPGDPPAGH
jgi:rhamnogalacturonan endolyase